MSKFTYSGYVEIQHINARKSGEEGEKELEVDLKLTTQCDRDVLDYFDPVVEGDDGPRIADALFLTGGAVRNFYLGPLTFGNILEHYALELFGERIVGCKVKKFSIEPKDTNRIVLTFQVSFAPTGDLMAKIAEFLQEAIEIKLAPEDGDLFDAAKDSAQKIDKLLREDGTTATISDGSGNVLASFGDGPDPLYDQAKAIVLAERKPSISLVQRHLQIGYNRAARLIEQMEKDGIVSAMAADGTRTVIAQEGGAA